MKNRLQLLEQTADTKYFLEQIQHLGQVVTVFYSTHRALGDSIILKKITPDSNLNRHIIDRFTSQLSAA